MRELLIIFCVAFAAAACEQDTGIRQIPDGYIGVLDNGSIIHSGNYYRLPDNPRVYPTRWLYEVAIPTSSGEHIATITVFVSDEELESCARAFGTRLRPSDEVMNNLLQRSVFENNWSAEEYMRRGARGEIVREMRGNTPRSISLSELLAQTS